MPFGDGTGPRGMGEVLATAQVSAGPVLLTRYRGDGGLALAGEAGAAAEAVG